MSIHQPCIILLAEDDPDDRILFRDAVDTLGDEFTIIEVDNGQSTLDLLKTAEVLPDFIVLDINMPRITGIGCLKAIRGDARLKDIPVVIMSTSMNEATIAEARDAGATRYAVKPASFNELIAVVRYMCKKELTSVADDFILNRAVV